MTIAQCKNYLLKHCYSVATITSGLPDLQVPDFECVECGSMVGKGESGLMLQVMKESLPLSLCSVCIVDMDVDKLDAILAFEALSNE